VLEAVSALEVVMSGSPVSVDEFVPGEVLAVVVSGSSAVMIVLQAVRQVATASSEGGVMRCMTRAQFSKQYSELSAPQGCW